MRFYFFIAIAGTSCSVLVFFSPFMGGEHGPGSREPRMSIFGWCSQSHRKSCNTPQHTATHCNTLQHTATHYNTLQHSEHTATHCITPRAFATAELGRMLKKAVPSLLLRPFP